MKNGLVSKSLSLISSKPLSGLAQNLEDGRADRKSELQNSPRSNQVKFESKNDQGSFEFRKF